MNPMNKVNQVRISSPIFSGLLYSLICMIVSTLLISFILMFPSLKEESLSTYVYIIHCLSIFIGGFISGKRAGKKGWYHGGMLGILYSAIIVIVSFLGFDAAVTAYTLILVLLSFAMGAFGGMLGVNLRS